MPRYCLAENYSEIWHGASEALNSAFTSAFVSSLAGAALGASAAYLFARNTQRKQELLSTYRKTNNGIVVAATIANNTMSLKNQYVLPLSEKFYADVRRAEQIREHHMLKGTKGEFSLEAEMKKISPLVLPLDALKNFVYSMDLAPGRAISLASMVEQSSAELNESISMRSALIDEFRSSNFTEEELAFNYLGLVGQDGNTNSMYADSLDGIVKYTDDVIFFSVELTEELMAHSAKVHDKLKSSIKDLPKPYSVDFSRPKELGLIPQRSNYESWLGSFKARNETDKPAT